MSGSSLLSARHHCKVLHNSTHNSDPSMYADNEWIHAPYVWPEAAESNTVYTILHDEYHGFEHNNCAMEPWKKGYCQLFALTAGVSRDGGRSWSHLAPPPTHLVAAAPYRYVDNSSQLWFGWGDTGGIVREPDTGFFYTTGHNRATVGAQGNGTCVLRTHDLTDPTSWRGWNGSAFATVFHNPYKNPEADSEVLTTPSTGICLPLENGNGPGRLPRGTWRQGLVNQGLVWSTQHRVFVGVFWNTHHDLAIANGAPFVYATSKDLVAWSGVAALDVSDWIPVSIEQVMYPSLLDPECQQRGARNFDTVGSTGQLFFTQATGKGTPRQYHWEALVHLPVTIQGSDTKQQ